MIVILSCNRGGSIGHGPNHQNNIESGGMSQELLYEGWPNKKKLTIFIIIICIRKNRQRNERHHPGNKFVVYVFFEQS